VRCGRLVSAHDVSDGGIACALAESCIAGGIGATVEWARAQQADPAEARLVLFGEGAGGFVVSGPADSLAELAAEAGQTSLVLLGTVGGDRLELTASAASLTLPVEALRTAHEQALPRLLQ
jgi:phosphoribosylformylglycinamidine (FGAM) synthase-like enzyme